MHPNTLSQYFVWAWRMIVANSIVLWTLLFLGLYSTSALFLRDTAIYWPLNISSAIMSILVTPVFYGIYYELIEDNYSSVKEISTVYVPRYLWLLMRMYIPVLFVAGFPAALLPSAGIGGYFETTIVASSLLYLYVIPFYYRSGRQQGAILGGIRFLTHNLSRSTPLLLAVLLLETTVLLFQQFKEALLLQGTMIVALAELTIFLCASIIDLVIFIILIFMIKEAEGKKVE